jgi:8-oxo-dGTP pyrophosphatase MutT (NUDIX family)
MHRIGEIDPSWFDRVDDLPERISAGGVVMRIHGGLAHVALVREIDEDGLELEGYVLPKGGIEDAEDLDAGAIREVEEEVGLTEITKLADLAVLERLSLNKRYWSVNHYQLFITDQESGEILDKDHHFDFGWFPIDTLPDMFWPDEKRMLERNRAEIYDRVIAAKNPKARKKYFM